MHTRLVEEVFLFDFVIIVRIIFIVSIHLLHFILQLTPVKLLDAYFIKSIAVLLCVYISLCLLLFLFFLRIKFDNIATFWLSVLFSYKSLLLKFFTSFKHVLSKCGVQLNYFRTCAIKIYDFKLKFLESSSSIIPYI